MDALGLSSICFNFGFDKSSKATKANIDKLKRSLDRLSDLLNTCCKTFGVGCKVDVKANYDYNQKNVPTGGYDGSVYPNFGAIAGGEGCIPVLVTTQTITTEWQGNTIQANAISPEGVGTIYNINGSDDGTLAHEAGHHGGYSAGDLDGGYHSSDPNNPMSGPGGPRNRPDKCFCEGVAGLAK